MNSFGAGAVIVLAVAIGIYYQQYFGDETPTARRAWLTLLNNDEYVPGVLALARSLKRVKSAYPLVVMITLDTVSQEGQQLVLDEGCQLRPIETLLPKQDKKNLAFERFIHGWTKLRAFQMIDVCDKCVMMDADIIVLQNMDELFELEDNPNFAAVQTCICNPAKNPLYPDYWKPQNCPYTHEQHSHSSAEVDSRGRMFNGGLFLLHPNQTVFEEMLVALNTWDLSLFKFSDQDFLNKFYHTTWRRLPYVYNTLKTFSKTHPYLWNETKIKAIHYILAKPWDKLDPDNAAYEEINRLWQEAYDWREQTTAQSPTNI
ncbi:unnamed protein product [Didymodactylos carnosus]|uniref:glycogenin glucosyltransferase n=1 Tax=Didymodactylos carnosus TaxID=1234261 RepID=A0A814DX33_9BILA|nr:unnamed protein product [Didymodactylos carnosus]CAF1180204.1 unnamed protein product [Didymodactylos carnosus]CAF3733223.1 unnamed protein product [Didymodactylos carnosus]CAF3991465.1 unnamed protein product [Didymodactylos carnosus]